ncbi:MAG: 16S rRNA (adenine(1518)-N(6)/adenine(1519)-N(6))-dimethyltransferase RsmA [Bacteroidota bacterium]
MVVPKKSLGQNFLRDENIARKIAAEIDPKRNDVLLEIGPGTGALTAYLAGATDHYLGVEVDPRSLELLRTRFPKAEFLQKSILDVRLDDLERRFGSKIRVAGNIPYYITSEILFWIIDQRTHVTDAVLMMQLEVARRLTAKPRTKDYGILSVVTQLYGAPLIAFKVSPNSFFPVPAVDSALVHITMRQDVPSHNEDLLRHMVRGTFGKRRKTLYNGLRYAGYPQGSLKQLTADLSRRPEELSVEEFLALTTELEPLWNSQEMNTIRNTHA